MAGKNIVVGSRLVNGLIIEHPSNPKITAEIKGFSASNIIGATFMTTEIDGDLWAAWIAKNKEFPAVLSNAIFAVNSANDAAAKAKEVAKEKTGFEGMARTAAGVKPADKD